MLLVGNVVINRVVATCDVFQNTSTIQQVIYQKNAFAGVGSSLWYGNATKKEREFALKCINGYRANPANDALWFKNPGRNQNCPSRFYGDLSGRYKNHCFYVPDQKEKCNL